MSLRLRLSVFFSAFIALTLAVVGVASFALTERLLDAALNQRADEAMARLDGARFSDIDSLLPADVRWDLSIIGGSNVRIESVEDLRLFSMLFRSGEVVLRDLLTSEEEQELVETGEATRHVRLASGEEIRIQARLGTVLMQSGQESYTAVLLVGVPATSFTAALGQLRTALFLTALVALILSFIGVWILARGVLSPLNRITQSASRVTGQDLSQRVPVPDSNDEIKELAVTINRMLARLEESFDTQRRFTADASHELRTPVTAIQGHSNYLLRRTRPDPEQVDSLQVIRRESERMAKLVNDLLELARADAGFSIELQPMNLVEVAENVHLEISPTAGAAQITVSSPQPVMEVMGDAGRLKQVILNLVQNAMNAGAANIGVHFTQMNGGVEMEVLDDGPGIPELAIPHLFERFYRVDGARSTRGNGSGLGLAIVYWIVQQHGGTLEVESRVGEGTVFRISLPSPGGPGIRPASRPDRG